MMKLVIAACVVSIGGCATTYSDTKRGSNLSSTDDEHYSYVVLDGKRLKVSWNDGDTFSSRGSKRRIKARLHGYNTLESYAPVHRWGGWMPQELYDLAKISGVEAASREWHCHDTGKSGGYRRKLVDCPELRRSLLRKGLAHVFVVEGAALAEDVALQGRAIKDKRGIWQKGAPEHLLTSLHSVDERNNSNEGYNRLCSVTTGVAAIYRHSDRYEVCQEICHGGSCMLYIPYKQRYGKDRIQCP
jgi:micrococcal nuclease